MVNLVLYLCTVPSAVPKTMTTEPPRAVGPWSLLVLSYQLAYLLHFGLFQLSYSQITCISSSGESLQLLLKSRMGEIALGRASSAVL